MIKVCVNGWRRYEVPCLLECAAPLIERVKDYNHEKDNQRH